MSQKPSGGEQTNHSKFFDVYFITASGKRLRSRKEVARFFGLQVSVMPWPNKERILSLNHEDPLRQRRECRALLRPAGVRHDVARKDLVP